MSSEKQAKHSLFKQLRTIASSQIKKTTVLEVKLFLNFKITAKNLST